jgi:hypothetical protein
MKREDMLKKTIADAEQRARHLEQRAAATARRHAEAAAQQDDRAAVAHLGPRAAYDEVKRRREARGVRADHGAVLGALPFHQQKLYKREAR